MPGEFKPCSGGCTCGEVRYEVKAKPLIVHACHCSWCQRQTGGPHVINGVFEAELVELTKGEVETIDTPSPSGRGQLIARSPTCKIAVWSNYHFGGMRERVRFVRAGTLDEPSLMPPDVHIFTSTKLPWYVIPEGQQVEEEFYDIASTWSKESQERYMKWKNGAC